MSAAGGPHADPLVAATPAGWVDAAAAGWQDLLRLEQQWFAPLCAQLQAGRWSALTLAFGDRAYTLRRAHRWRAWRRPHAWWKEIGR